MLLSKVKVQVSIWLSGNPEQLIMPIQQAIIAINQRGLKEVYKKLVGTDKEFMSKLEEAQLSLEISLSKVEEDCAQAKTRKWPWRLMTRPRNLS